MLRGHEPYLADVCVVSQLKLQPLCSESSTLPLWLLLLGLHVLLRRLSGREADGGAADLV